MTPLAIRTKMDKITSLYYEERNFSAVKDAYQNKLNELDGSEQRENCLFNIACCHASSGNLDAAIEIFATIESKDNPLLYNKALCFYKCGKFQESIVYLDEIIANCEKSVPKLFMINDRQLFNQQTNQDGSELDLLGSLQNSCLIETLNLKAASVFKLTGNPQVSKNILDKSPVKSLDLIDCVTLNNQAIYNQGFNPFECLNYLSHLIKLHQNDAKSQVPIEAHLNFVAILQKNFHPKLALEFVSTYREKFEKSVPKEFLKYYDLILERHKLSDDIYCTNLDLFLDNLLRNLAKSEPTNDGGSSMNKLYERELLIRLIQMVTNNLSNILWDNNQYKLMERLFTKTRSSLRIDQKLWTENFAHILFMMDNRFEECIQLYEQFLPKEDSESILSVDPVVLSNLCIAYVLTGHNNDAEDIIKEVEEEEESQKAANNLDEWHINSATRTRSAQNPPSQSRIINAAIETLYCVKNNYEFGLTRMFRTLEPIEQKLDRNSWYHVKRCILALLENHSRQLIYVRDDLLNQIVNFLIGCERLNSHQIGIKVTDDAIKSPTNPGNPKNSSSNDRLEPVNDISALHSNIPQEASYLRSLLLNIIHD